MDLESRKAKEPKEPKSLNFLLHKKLEYPLEGSNYRNLRILSEACVKQYTPPPGVDSKFDLIHPKSPRQLSALSSMAQQFFDTNKAEFLSETWTKDKLARETEQVKSVVQRMMQRNLSKERGEMHEVREHLQPAEHVSDHPRQVPRDARASHLGEPELSPGMKTPSFLNSEGPEVQQGINPGGAQTTVLPSDRGLRDGTSGESSSSSEVRPSAQDPAHQATVEDCPEDSANHRRRVSFDVPVHAQDSDAEDVSMEMLEADENQASYEIAEEEMDRESSESDSSSDEYRPNSTQRQSLPAKRKRATKVARPTKLRQKNKEPPTPQRLQQLAKARAVWREKSRQKKELAFHRNQQTAGTRTGTDQPVGDQSSVPAATSMSTTSPRASDRGTGEETAHVPRDSESNDPSPVDPVNGSVAPQPTNDVGPGVSNSTTTTTPAVPSPAGGHMVKKGDIRVFSLIRYLPPDQPPCQIGQHLDLNMSWEKVTQNVSTLLSIRHVDALRICIGDILTVVTNQREWTIVQWDIVRILCTKHIDLEVKKRHGEEITEHSKILCCVLSVVDPDPSLRHTISRSLVRQKV